MQLSAEFHFYFPVSQQIASKFHKQTLKSLNRLLKHKYIYCILVVVTPLTNQLNSVLISKLGQGFEPCGELRQGQSLTPLEAHPYPFLSRVPLCAMYAQCTCMYVCRSMYVCVYVCMYVVRTHVYVCIPCHQKNVIIYTERDMAQWLERGALPMSLQFRIPLGAEFLDK